MYIWTLSRDGRATAAAQCWHHHHQPSAVLAQTSLLLRRHAAGSTLRNTVPRPNRSFVRAFSVSPLDNCEDTFGGGTQRERDRCARRMCVCVCETSARGRANVLALAIGVLIQVWVHFWCHDGEPRLLRTDQHDTSQRLACVHERRRRAEQQARNRFRKQSISTDEETPQTGG